MVAKHDVKPPANRLELSSDTFAIGRTAPHLWYANLDFRKPATGDGTKLLRWLEPNLSPRRGWDRNRTLRYLEEHQEEFRRCLQWISNGSVVDYRGRFADEETYVDYQWHEMWDKEPVVRFLQKHGIDHGGIILEPLPRYDGDRNSFSGLQLSQRQAKDPLDPICWHLLFLLSAYGTVFVRRCGYWDCGKFIWPRTTRKQFCSDSCRALHHVAKIYPDELDDLLGEEDVETEKDKFRKRRAEYMRKYRALPQVKLRLPKRKV